MIRNVKIEDGTYSLTVSLDENLMFGNTWTRIGGNPRVCPPKGSWKFGKNANAHFLYLIDEKGNSILLLSELGKNVGDRGLGTFLSESHAISRNVMIGWRITKVDKEFFD